MRAALAKLLITAGRLLASCGDQSPKPRLGENVDVYV